jgi:hypothetical protein
MEFRTAGKKDERPDLSSRSFAPETEGNSGSAVTIQFSHELTRRAKPRRVHPWFS